MALTQAQVSQLYVTLFGRAADGEGMAFWQGKASQEEAAKEMLATDAAKAFYGDAVNKDKDFVIFIYKNVLNKTAAQDPDGIKFWTDALTAGASREKVVTDLINSINQYKSATEETTKASYDLFTNKVKVSNHAADKINKVSKDASGNYDFQPFKGYIDSVTKDASSVDTTNTKIDGDAASQPVEPVKPNPGTEFKFTAFADKLVGTEKDDKFSGDLATIQATLDNVDGKDGYDTVELNAILATPAAYAAGTAAKINATNVEKIKIVNNEAIELNAADTKVFKDVELQSTVDTKALAVAYTKDTGDVSTIGGSTVGITTAAGDAKVGKISIDNAAGNVTIGGASNTLKVENLTLKNLNPASAQTVTINAAAGERTLTIDAENINSKHDATNTVSLADAEATALVLNATGTKDVDLALAATTAKLKTIDASASKASVTLTITDAGDNKLKSVKLGSGDDVLTVGDSATATYDGGDGYDVINLGAKNYTNFEAFGIQGNLGANTTIDMSKTTDMGIDVIAALATTDVTLSKLANGQKLTIHDGVTTTQTITLKHGADKSSTADSLDVILGKTTGGVTVTNLATDVEIAGNVIETLNITSNGKSANTITEADWANVKKVVATGDAALTLTAATAPIKTDFDASALKGDLTATIGKNAAIDLKAGAGKDAITLHDDGVGASKIDLGAGDDTITIGAAGGGTTITGGAGKDKFIATSTHTAKDKYVTITDFEKGDTIKLSASSLEFQKDKVTVAEEQDQTYDNFIDAAAATADTVTWFQFKGNTYIVNNGSSAGYAAGDDAVIKLTGLIDLSTIKLNASSEIANGDLTLA